MRKDSGCTRFVMTGSLALISILSRLPNGLHQRTPVANPVFVGCLRCIAPPMSYSNKTEFGIPMPSSRPTHVISARSEFLSETSYPPRSHRLIRCLLPLQFSVDRPPWRVLLFNQQEHY